MSGVSVGVVLTVISWLADRFKEKSTHQGITMLSGVLMIWFTPELTEQIVYVAGGVLGLIQIIFKEQRGPPGLPEIEINGKGK